MIVLFFWIIPFIVLAFLAWQDYKEQQVCSEGIVAFVLACIVNASFVSSNFFGVLFWAVLPLLLALFRVIAIADFVVLLFLPLWLGVSTALQVFFFTLMMLSVVCLANWLMHRQVKKTYFLPFLMLALSLKYLITVIGLIR